MLERPNLPDERIITCLEGQYGFEAVTLEFLPIGNDATAWVYRISADEAQRYFLKIKRGRFTTASVEVPHYLHQAGILQVVAPVPNLIGALVTPVDDFGLVIYPYVDGRTGMEIGLNTQQTVEFGQILRQIHSVSLSPELLSKVTREAFILKPDWLHFISRLQQTVHTRVCSDAYQAELAEFWLDHADEIGSVVRRAVSLGQSLQTHSLPYVLCHSDIHTANVLVDHAGELHIVDWDQPVMAPKERDLMFVLYALAEAGQESAFERSVMQGYGQVTVDRLALAYYRYEWVVQEFGDYVERLFFMDDVGEETKQDAVRGFKQLFDKGDVVDQARAAENRLS